MGLSNLFPLVLLCLGARADVMVETHSGRVRGAIKQFHGQDGSGQYFSFKGIPYAQPPVGETWSGGTRNLSATGMERFEDDINLV